MSISETCIEVRKKTMNILRREVRHILVQQCVEMQPMIVELRNNMCG